MDLHLHNNLIELILYILLFLRGFHIIPVVNCYILVRPHSTLLIGPERLG
jgi:hypothetical protein